MQLPLWHLVPQCLVCWPPSTTGFGSTGLLLTLVSEDSGKGGEGGIRVWLWPSCTKSISHCFSFSCINRDATDNASPPYTSKLHQDINLVETNDVLSLSLTFVPIYVSWVILLSTYLIQHLLGMVYVCKATTATRSGGNTVWGTTHSDLVTSGVSLVPILTDWLNSLEQVWETNSSSSTYMQQSWSIHVAFLVSMPWSLPSWHRGHLLISSTPQMECPTYPWNI